MNPARNQRIFPQSDKLATQMRVQADAPKQSSLICRGKRTLQIIHTHTTSGCKNI